MLLLCLRSRSLLHRGTFQSDIYSCPDLHCQQCYPAYRSTGCSGQWQRNNRSLVVWTAFSLGCAYLERGGVPAGPAPSEDGTPPPPPPLPVELLQTGDVAALWSSAAAGPSPAHVLTNGATPPGTTQHGVASNRTAADEPSLIGETFGGHQKASLWQRQPGHDTPSSTPHASSSSGWMQQQAYRGQQGHVHQDSQTGGYGSSWQGTGTLRPEQKHAEQQGNSYGVSGAQADGWHGSAQAQALGPGYVGQPGSLGSMLQGIMTSVRSRAGSSPAHLHPAPSPGQGSWPPLGVPQSPAGGQISANGLRSGPALPGENVHHQQASQPGAVARPWYG